MSAPASSAAAPSVEGRVAVAGMLDVDVSGRSSAEAAPALSASTICGDWPGGSRVLLRALGALDCCSCCCCCSLAARSARRCLAPCSSCSISATLSLSKLSSWKSPSPPSSSCSCLSCSCTRRRSSSCSASSFTLSDSRVTSMSRKRCSTFSASFRASSALRSAASFSAILSFICVCKCCRRFCKVVFACVASFASSFGRGLGSRDGLRPRPPGLGSLPALLEVARLRCTASFSVSRSAFWVRNPSTSASSLSNWSASA
mmetsp:Transcript_59167/g.141272  ORF Transcript_59167/g.141272 Transcript_59167/m.141272 type:complete len:259 (-) Transcript_59167:671-1447(-)